MPVNLLREDEKNYNLVDPDAENGSSDSENAGKKSGRQNPHDKLFKSYFSDLEVVRDLLQLVLKEETFKKLDMSTMEREDRTFISDDLQESFSDVIYSVNCGERKVNLALILEHKSYRDRKITFQMLDYIGNYMKREYLDTGELPPIIPILIYQARDSDDSGLIDLVDNFADLSRDIKRYQVIFEVVEFKLTNLTWQEVSSRIIKIYSLAATMETAADEINRLEEIASALAALADKKRLDFVRRKLVSLSEYILTVTELDEKKIRDIIEAKLPGGGDIVESTAERLRKEGRKKGREEGRKEGRKKGRKEGRKEGMAKTLTSQLKKKFSGELPEDIKQLMEKADKEDLIKIRDNIFDIDDIDDVRELLKEE